MTRDIDYAGIEVPEDTDPEDYHYTHRRAELLDKVLEAGTPAAIHQTETADMYGVDQSTIHNDLKILGEYIAEHIGEQAHLESEAVYSKAIEGLLEEAEEGNWRAYKAAVEIVMKRNEWLGDIGQQHREPDRSEVDLDADVHSRAIEAGYQVVDVESSDADRDGEYPVLVDGAESDADSDTDGDHPVLLDGDEDIGFTATPNAGVAGGDVDTDEESR